MKLELKLRIRKEILDKATDALLLIPFQFFTQDVTVQVWLCSSEQPRHVIKSQSGTVSSYLTKLLWDSHISRITAQSVSLPSLIGHRDLLQRRGSFSFYIRPVLNGIDGSGSGQAQLRGGGWRVRWWWPGAVSIQISYGRKCIRKFPQLLLLGLLSSVSELRNDWSYPQSAE